MISGANLELRSTHPYLFVFRDSSAELAMDQVEVRETDFTISGSGSNEVANDYK